ncbi:hypothetical protein [Embleya sp. MST-111070]|uniref:hypothetical protein n=1 Tax=Embleya sp. MST-111070 TaxID=3398231 RepID=UPI003F73BB20
MYDPATLSPTYADALDIDTWWLLAPDVDRDALGQLKGKRRERAVEALGTRAVWKNSLGVLGYEPAPGQPYGRARLGTLHGVYMEAWTSALPVADLVDLGRLDHHLAYEFWYCIETLRDVVDLQQQDYETGALQERLLAAFDDRLTDMRNIAEEHRRLHTELRSDPTTMPETVRRVLHDAEVRELLRPGRDLADFTAALRTLITELHSGDSEIPSGG